MSARSETLEGIDPESRAWLGSYLDVFAKKYAHELAEKQRAVVEHHEGLGFLSDLTPSKLIAVIDPEVSDSGA